MSGLYEYERVAASDAPDDMTPEPNFLYRYFNEEGFLLYLGITRALSERDGAHWNTRWHHLADYMLVETFPTRKLVQSAEFHAYTAEQPYFNCKVHYCYDFEAPWNRWYGERTGFKWVGYNPQWFRYDWPEQIPIDAPEWWHHGRPQAPVGSFEDPRRRSVMG